MNINVFFFFFNDTATTEIYTLSLHDALPICEGGAQAPQARQGRVLAEDLHRLEQRRGDPASGDGGAQRGESERSEEHTSELQSRQYLVCRLLLEKKKKKTIHHMMLHLYRTTI